MNNQFRVGIQVGRTGHWKW